ncbi:MAG: ATP-dependent zinc metalloprotease FtsH [Bacteroidales bacterium]|jgi:cell division protease FtsH|nr:ATP-dependent zinc metalloprotease FtsH [Bacteroidales bacterium]
MNNSPQNNNPLPGGNNRPNDPSRRPKIGIYWLYIALFATFIGMQFIHFGGQKTPISWITFKKEILQAGDVEKIVIVNQKEADIYVRQDRIKSSKYHKYFKEGEDPPAPQFNMNIGSLDIFMKQLEDAQADVPEEMRVSPEYEERKDFFGDMLSWILPLILIIVIWMFVFRRMSGGGVGGIFNVGKSRAQIFDKEKISVKIDFKDVAGLEEAKVEVKEIVDFLKNPKKYTDLGGKIPKGALLVGPPGTGKTLLAKAVAGEANVPFFSLSGSDFVEMFVGVGASRVRDLFKQAKEKAPCIIFIDEIDAIGRARGKSPNFGANDERENTLNQLLTEMDGFGSNVGIIILAATNRADILDKALLRAGRFDRQVHVELPDLNERKEIFQVHLRPLKIESGLDTDFLSKQTPGFSGADIANVCNEAALIAARKNKQSVEKQDFLDAVDRIVGGLERKNKIITSQEKRTIAYHEAGHATVSWMLEHASPLLKVTIIPRGRALGAAWYQPEERQITTVEQLFDEMCATLGGRASEDLTFHTISTGALNDLERVTKQAYAMVSYYGMGQQLGNMSFYDSSGQSEYAFTKPYSDKTSESIDKEAFDLVNRAYQRAKDILVKHQDGLKQLAELLLEKEVIFVEDLEKIFGERPFKKETGKNAEQQAPPNNLN